MYESFLSVTNTEPYCRRDFVEWHHGIAHYGFWAVLVGEQNWHDLLKDARAHVKQFIHNGYRRAPHVTIAAAGLISEDLFSPYLQKSQSTALAEAGVRPFPLLAGAIDSFTTAPYITVEDPSGGLGQIRSILATVAGEDDPACYTPHLTLGLYLDAYDTAQVAAHLRAFQPVNPGPLLVTELAFCAYETRDIQGPFVILDRVDLSGDQRIGK